MNKLVWIILLVLTPVGAVAQIIQSGRFEISLSEEESEKYLAAGLNEKGLMLYRRLTGKKEDQIELVKIDTSLHENWKGYVTVSHNLELMQVQHRQDLFFLLFRIRDRVGGDFEIVAVKLVSGDFGKYTVKNLIPFNPTEFILTNQAAMIGGYFNYRPIVLYYSFSDQRSKVLPGFFNSPGELDQLKAYDDGSVDVVVSARNFEKRRALWIRNYDPQGELVKTTILQPEEEKNLIFGRSIKLANGEQVVAGVYGRFSDYSRGIFVAGINAIGEYAIQYYNFAQLRNFFSYMKARQQKRVKDRIERKTIRGKKIKFNYRFLVHDLVPYNNQLVLVGEAFYPHYIYPGPFTGTSFYDPQVRTNMIFDGYQYTHAVVIGFKNNGKLEWDNSFEINDVRSFQLEQLVKIKPEADRIVLMYLFDNAIRTKIIRNDQVLEGKSSDTIRATSADETMDTEGENSDQMDHWYRNYFYAFGTQKLKHRRGSSRKVFFVNKITYR